MLLESIDCFIAGEVFLQLFSAQQNSETMVDSILHSVVSTTSRLLYTIQAGSGSTNRSKSSLP